MELRPFLHLGVVAIEKGASWSTSTKVANFTFYIHIWIYMYVCVCVYICIHIYSYTHTFIYMYICIYVYMCIWICMYIYEYICMYMCVCVYMYRDMYDYCHVVDHWGERDKECPLPLWVNSSPKEWLLRQDSNIGQFLTACLRK